MEAKKIRSKHWTMYQLLKKKKSQFVRQRNRIWEDTEGSIGSLEMLRPRYLPSTCFNGFFDAEYLQWLVNLFQKGGYEANCT